MLKHYAIIILTYLVFTNQSTAQSLKNLKEINTTWEKFYMAFDSLDYKHMAEIHSKKLIRISGGKRILDYENYINNYKIGFERAKNEKVVNAISLRFFERINNESIASERGIYKLSIVDKQGRKQIYYGQFHVLFEKVDGKWEITLDYDSNEGNTIGEKEYAKAHAINEFDMFIKN